MEQQALQDEDDEFERYLEEYMENRNITVDNQASLCVISNIKFLQQYKSTSDTDTKMPVNTEDSMQGKQSLGTKASKHTAAETSVMAGASLGEASTSARSIAKGAKPTSMSAPPAGSETVSKSAAASTDSQGGAAASTKPPAATTNAAPAPQATPNSPGCPWRKR